MNDEVRVRFENTLDDQLHLVFLPHDCRFGCHLASALDYFVVYGSTASDLKVLNAHHCGGTRRFRLRAPGSCAEFLQVYYNPYTPAIPPTVRCLLCNRGSNRGAPITLEQLPHHLAQASHLSHILDHLEGRFSPTSATGMRRKNGKADAVSRSFCQTYLPLVERRALCLTSQLYVPHGDFCHANRLYNPRSSQAEPTSTIIERCSILLEECVRKLSGEPTHAAARIADQAAYVRAQFRRMLEAADALQRVNHVLTMEQIATTSCPRRLLSWFELALEDFRDRSDGSGQQGEV